MVAGYHGDDAGATSLWGTILEGCSCGIHVYGLVHRTQDNTPPVYGRSSMIGNDKTLSRLNHFL